MEHTNGVKEPHSSSAACVYLWFFAAAALFEGGIPGQAGLGVAGCVSIYDAIIEERHPVSLPNSASESVRLEHGPTIPILFRDEQRLDGNPAEGNVRKLGITVAEVVVASLDWAALSAVKAVVISPTLQNTPKLCLVYDDSVNLIMIQERRSKLYEHRRKTLP